MFYFFVFYLYFHIDNLCWIKNSDSQIENGEMLVLSAAVLCCLNTGFVFLNYLFNSEVGFLVR